MAVVFGSAKNASLYYDELIDITQRSSDFDLQKTDDGKPDYEGVIKHTMALLKLYPRDFLKRKGIDPDESYKCAERCLGISSFRVIQPISEEDKVFGMIQYTDPFRASEFSGQSGWIMPLPLRGDLYRPKSTIQLDSRLFSSESEFSKSWARHFDIVVDSDVTEVIGDDDPDAGGLMSKVCQVPVVDARTASWEQIFAFREDSESVIKLRRMRIALQNECVGMSESHIEDFLLNTMEEYKSAAKSWGFEYSLRNMSLLCGAGAVPPLVTAVASIVGGVSPTPASLIVGSISFAGLAFEFARSGMSHAASVQQLPYAYLLDLKREFGESDFKG
ncbi:MAG: hypothetical protein ACX94C_08115 [Phycisphaerales bacterium]